jgi:phosphoribosylformimino-5-aminoimidazole carboxamide ribotide isomerase
VTYAGGAQSLQDLELVKQLGGGRVDLTIGSALDIFGGSLAYSDVVAWQRREESQQRIAMC